MSDPTTDTAGADSLGAALAEARQALPGAQVVFAVTGDVDAWSERATAVADAAGLSPWPDWAVARVGAGAGPHLLNVVADLAETGRSPGLVVCALAPVASVLLAQAAAVSADEELAVIVIDHTVDPAGELDQTEAAAEGADAAEAPADETAADGTPG
ncbi:MAG TPA: hypothetical protein VK866_12560 [Acidimicrobiales bacterium]|nr:hypothetical protein [Acidimicrobiales bacterium]